MRKSLFSSIIAIALFSTTAFAASNKDIIFSCTTDDGKPLTVQKVGDDYEYNHGQFRFKNPIKQVLANANTEIAGGSGFVTYSIELKNQGKSYRVGFIQARNSKSIDEPGVSIYQGDQYDRAIECNLTKSIKQHFSSTQIRRTGL